VSETSGSMPKPTHLIEAVLLSSERPLGLDILSSTTGLPEEEVRSALTGLMERFSAEHSGIVLRNVADGYLLSTNPACAPAVERFRVEARPAPLSGAAYEVLSCVLYQGPLTRGAISQVRGVNSDAVVRNLLNRGLLAEVGTDRTHPSSPAVLDVTEEFLVAADTASREDFPPLDSLVSEEELARVRERLAQAQPAEPPEVP
jgi:segregation and condensation protein B